MHPRLRRLALPLGVIATSAAITFAMTRDSAADLENLVFTSRTDHVRLIVPRGWRASDQPSYPGLLLWMARSQPQGQIVLTSERFTHELYCSWPPACRTSHEPLPVRYACALRQQLTARGLKVDATQPGPKENENAGLDTVWFEYQDAKHFLRHAIAFSGDRAFSLVLSAPNSEARATHTRAFEQALRTLQLLSDEDIAAAAPAPAPAPGPSNGDASTSDGGPVDAGAANLADASLIDAGTGFESAPAPRIDPISACN